MFNSWVQDKLFLKKTKMHIKSSWKTSFWGGWQKTSKKRGQIVPEKRLWQLKALCHSYMKSCLEKQEWGSSSSKSLSLENAVQSLICTSKYALMYYYGQRGDSCWRETQDKRQEFCKDNKHAASIMKLSKNHDIQTMIWFTK